MRSHLRLGTRRSLLAKAQSGAVARRLEALCPGVSVELVGIETRGDRILDVSLREVTGKEFFVAELDEALRRGDVDFTVHSLKDLSLERPAELICAAIPKRKNPRDVVLFGTKVIQKLKNNLPIQIGTSSPRRIENIPSYLAQALPRFSACEGATSFSVASASIAPPVPRLDFIEIRGNVNTRLARLFEQPGSPRHLDAVILAIAGLIRLFEDSDARREIAPLLKSVRWMVLPLQECPTAPGQGALAIECRRADTELTQVLSRLHDEGTAAEVLRERQLLAEWGGGCHQKFGATATETAELKNLFFVRGEKPGGEKVSQFSWEAPPPCLDLPTEIFPWDGSKWRDHSEFSHLPFDLPSSCTALFIAHSRALPQMDPAAVQCLFENRRRVWTSGTASLFRLAAQGIWVEGSSEGLGFENTVALLGEPLLGLPPLAEWGVLTHDDAEATWDAGQVIPTYHLAEASYSREARAALHVATHVFWQSFSQFEALNRDLPKNALHACGPGKTARLLREKNLNPLVFPSVKEWRKWLNIQ